MFPSPVGAVYSAPTELELFCDVSSYKDFAPMALHLHPTPVYAVDFVVIAGFLENQGYWLSIFGPLLALFMLFRARRDLHRAVVFSVSNVFTQLNQVPMR
jgi:hypothetical protein